jgi:hypothetical protein
MSKGEMALLIQVFCRYIEEGREKRRKKKVRAGDRDLITLNLSVDWLVFTRCNLMALQFPFLEIHCFLYLLDLIRRCPSMLLVTDNLVPSLDRYPFTCFIHLYL